AIHEKALGPKHPDLANPLLALGEVLLAQARPAAALAPLERALTLAPEGHIRAAMQFALARALWDARPPERTRAVTLATQARDYWKGIGMASEVATASQWLAAHGGP
ncbi:tetratricopeptide repeat protein, partial [Hyalangium sp.]|uniref:tetratricopeptide repeat protein n=1 Tax=Hyalangium sp. TaxID=2028555 RepID=UPI002D3CDF2C